MSFRTEKNGEDIDIIIDGFDQGIADDPYSGIADIRNINLISNPKEAAVGFANQAITLPPVVNALAFTATASSDLITVASTSGYYTGMAVIINSLSGGTGITNGYTYFIGSITSTTFKLYTDLILTHLVDITLDGSGTLSTAQFGTPVASTSGYSNVFGANGENYLDSFIIDNNGLVWLIGAGNSHGYGLNVLQFCGNTGHSSFVAGNLSFGLCSWKRYLLVFIGAKIDYIKLSDLFGTGPLATKWVYGWQDITDTSAKHQAIAATDDAVYFCNNNIGSILQVAGQTFDPSNAATYTFNDSALSLPSYDQATCLAQLGTLLLAGGIQNYIYPWDRIATSFSYPLIVAESFISNIVSSNSNAYIFAGNRGRIYVTNGANIQLFKKFPDQLSGTESPYYHWGGGLYYRNQLYFGVSATNNAGTAINNFAGVWSVSLEAANTIGSVVFGSIAGLLRLTNSLTTGSYAGSVPVLLPMGNINPAGNGLYVAYINGSGAGGIDTGSSNPYAAAEAYIDTDIIPIGTFYTQKTFKQIEFKLGKPLVSGESITLQQRSNLNDNYTTITSNWQSSGTSSVTVGEISDAKAVDFEKYQWIQFRVQLTSTSSSPSYVKLRELRIR